MVGDVLSYDNTTSLFYSHFDPTKPVKVIVHGFGSSGRKMWVLQMAEALLATVRCAWKLTIAFNYIMASKTKL